MRIAGALVCSVLLVVAARATQAVDIYVLDVEDGKSVPIVSKTKAQMIAPTAATACPLENSGPLHRE